MRYTLPILLLAILFNACKSDSTTSVNTNKNGLVTGSLAGAVATFDTLQMVDSHVSGVKVQLDGSSISAITNANSYWQIDNVPQGVHTLTITKAEFDTMQYFNVLVAGPGIEYSNFTYLYQIPRGSLTIDRVNDSLKNQQSFYLYLAPNGTASSMEQPIVIQFTKDISQFALGQATTLYQFTTLYSTQEATVGIATSLLDQAGLRSGDVCLIRIAKQGFGGYHVPPYNTNTQATIGPWSDIVRFTIP